MYMDGFQLVQGTTCVIYLFQSWVLDTGGKFAIAFIGTVLAGIGLEKIIQQRRHVMMIMKIPTMDTASPITIQRAKRRRLVASALFYGTQLTIGYMLMLVIMIYSGLLFFGTVLGLVSGHVMFNANDAIWPLKNISDDDDDEGDDDNKEESTQPSSDKPNEVRDGDGDDDHNSNRHQQDVPTTNGSCCMHSNPSTNLIGGMGEAPLDEGELHHGIDIEGRGCLSSTTPSSPNEHGSVDEKNKDTLLHDQNKSCCSTVTYTETSSERPTEITMDLNSNNMNDDGTLSSAASVDNNSSSQNATDSTVSHHPCGCSNKNNCDPNCSTNDVVSSDPTKADVEPSRTKDDKKSTSQSSSMQPNNQKRNSQPKKKKQNRSHGVAEGATPCCQHSL